MADAYQNFVNFDWSNEDWQAYLSGLYPAPNYKQVVKFKKKWYKKHVDPNFDESYDPSGAGADGATSAAGEARGTPVCSAGATASPADEGRQWSALGAQGAVCLGGYVLGLVLTLGTFAGFVDSLTPLGLLTGSCIAELLARHKLRFSVEWVQDIAQEEVGAIPFLSIVFLTPGLHKAFRVLALAPVGLASFSSASMLCRHLGCLPIWISKAAAPITEAGTRYFLLQTRADAEVILGIALIVAAFYGFSSPLIPLLYGNTMVMRYTISPWSQAAFRKLEGILSMVLGRIPVINTAYEKLKDLLYSFVVPSAEQGT